MGYFPFSYFFASVLFLFFAMLKVISSTFTRLLNELIGGSGSKNDGISWYVYKLKEGASGQGFWL
jgi:hypothetical protein